MLDNTTPPNIDEIIDHDRTIKIGKTTVHIDRTQLKFNEANLSEYLEREGIWYDHFGEMFADAEFERDYFDLKAEEKYSQKYAEFKESGATDKLAEAQAKSDHEVVKAKETALTAKHKVKLLLQHLKAFDKTHENAQNRGNTLRKEIDKLDRGIFTPGDDKLAGRIDDIIGKSEE